MDHPFFYNVYALKREANAMKPTAGALIWTRSQNVEPGDLDLHISGAHVIDPNASPTGGAIVMGQPRLQCPWAMCADPWPEPEPNARESRS
jgi:hypothetical protein